MYQAGLGGGGAAGVVGGAIILPNTSGNKFLLIVAISSIFIGLTIVVSTIARLIAKRAYKA